MQRRQRHGYITGACGQEENSFYETIVFEAIGNVNNAGKQKLAALRYQQLVSRKSDDEVFHNESGYWLWDAEQGIVMQVLTIPRGVCLGAGGSYRGDGQDAEFKLEVRAATDNAEFGIVQSPFMRDNTRTVEFRHEISVSGDTLTYDETTVLKIYSKRFDHTDENTLIRG